jgi:hypothetical protein
VRIFFACAGLLFAVGGAAPSLAQSPAPAPATAAPLDSENLAIAQEIVALAYPPESRHAMLMRVSDSMTGQMRRAVFPPNGNPPDAAMQQIFDRYLDRVRAVTDRSFTDGIPAIFEAFARAYARQFSRDDLVQIRAFVSTPAGARYLQRSAELLSDPDVAEANSAYMATAFHAVQPLMDDLRREIAAYVARRPRR